MSKSNPATPEVNFNFRYPDTHDPVLIELKELATITIDPQATELERVKNILGYAHGMFTHNGDNQPSSLDPITIIKEARLGKEFRCVEYSLLAVALLWAYAIPARMVGLKTSDVETREYGAGHAVIEFWGPDFEKWIMCDVQAGIIPSSLSSLLSAFELGEKVKHDLSIDYVPVNGSRFAKNSSFATMQSYTDWVKEYLYFFDTPIEIIFSDTDLSKQQIAMLVPQGVKPPKMFQNLFAMNAVYTHSMLDFYPKM